MKDLELNVMFSLKTNIIERQSFRKCWGEKGPSQNTPVLILVVSDLTERCMYIKIPEGNSVER